MAIVFEGRTSNSLNNVTSGTIDLPAGTTSGDLLLFVYDVDGNNGLQALTGFNELFGGPVPGSGGSFRGGVQWRVADGTEPATYTVNTVSGGERAAFALLRYSGVDETTPINASGSNTGGSNTSVIFPSTVTTNVADTTVVAVISNESGNAGNPIVPSWPGGWTERYDNENGPPGGGNGSAACAAADFEFAGPGTISSETVTITGGNSFWISFYVALAPAAVGPIELTTVSIESATEVDTPSILLDDVSLTTVSIESATETGTPSVTGVDQQIRVQRGQTDIARDGTTTATITAVTALSAAFELNSNSRNMHGGPPSSTATQNVDDMSALVELTNTTTLSFDRVITSSTDLMRAAWEVVEYIGNPGGPNEFIIRSRNTVELSGVTNIRVPMDTLPTDINRCVPFITGVMNTGSVADGAPGAVIARCRDISGEELEINRRVVTGTTTVQVVVVEFTGSNWGVFHAYDTSEAFPTGSFTIYEDAVGSSGTVGDVGNWDNALIFGTISADVDTIASLGALHTPGANTSTVDFELDTDEALSHGHGIHVVSNPEMTVTRFTDTQNAQGANNVDVTSAGLTDLQQSMVIGRSITSGTDSTYGRGWRNFRLTSLTNVEHWCHRSGNTMSHNIQVIDLSGLEAVPIYTTDSVESATETSSPALSQQSNLTSDSVESATETGTPSVIVIGDTDDVESATETSAPDLSVNIAFPVTGEDITIGLGDVDVQTGFLVPVTGEDITIGLGDVVVPQAVVVPVTGEDITIGLGDVVVAANAAAPVTGEDITINQGDVTVIGDATAPVTGEDITIDVGDAFAFSPIEVPVTGEDITIGLGDVVVVANATAPVTGEDIAINLGDVTLVISGTAPVTGEDITIDIGNVIARSVARVEVTGFEIDVEAGIINIWGAVAPGIDTVWTPVDDTQTPGWTPVDDSQSPNWTPVDDTSTTSWDPVNDAQDPSWTEIVTD